MGVARGARIVGTAAIVSIASIACTPTDDDPTAGDGREAAVYESILGWMLDDGPIPATTERPDWTMFVARRAEEPIGVDVQALVVEALDERVEIRFIDERGEAVDDGEENLPVRDDGILVGLGAVPSDGDEIDVYVDRYRNVEDVQAWEFTIRRSGAAWSVVGSPQSSDVRPLPSAD